jgi:dCMP deaminase
MAEQRVDVGGLENVLFRAMELALDVARGSLGPRTQNGAVLVDELVGIILGDTCFANGLVGMVRDVPERWERPAKYSYIEHAERGAIYQAARSGIVTDGLTLVCPWCACTDCARAIVASGIRRVVRLERREGGSGEQWAESVGAGDVMLGEAGVDVICVGGLFGVAPLLRNGEVFWP